MSFGDFIVCMGESGDHGLASINPEHPLFVLFFCVFRKDSYAGIMTPAIRDLKFRTFGHDVVVPREIDVRKKKGAFSRLGKAARLTHLVCEARGAREDVELGLEFRAEDGGGAKSVPPRKQKCPQVVPGAQRRPGSLNPFAAVLAEIVVCDFTVPSPCKRGDGEPH